MPGIENVNVTYYNNGALAKISIDIKCYTRRQLALIDYLYLRPGYSLLLEFGWSVYYDNNLTNPSLITNPPWNTDPFNTLFDSNKSQYDMYSSIRKEKEERFGNYEAFFGKITNFKWNLNSDGSYSCNVTLTTLGDVIESLKLNIAAVDTTNLNTSPQEDGVEAVIAFQNISELNNIFYKLYENRPPDKGGDYSVSLTSLKNGTPSPISINFTNSIWTSKGVTIDDGWVWNDYSDQVWIKFGVLCAILQSKFLLYNKDKIPYIGFDIDYENLDNDDNYMLTFPGQISGDPSICLIPLTRPDSSTGLTYNEMISGPRKSNITPEWDFSKFNVTGSSGSDFQGRLCNVLVNVSFLSKAVYNLPKDEDNSISILDYLKEVLNGINAALGGINNFSIEPSIEDGLIRFYDKAPQIQSSPNPSKKYSTFNVFGVRDNEGSFIKNIDMSSELSSKFSSMVSIGAQSQGNQVQANATAFSEFNAGLKDRIIKEKLPQSATQNSINNNPTISLGFNDAFQKVYSDKIWEPEFLEALRNTITEYNKLFLGYYYSIDRTTVPFFIPFTLNLEMDGLAGMVLYQKFLIYENVLPLSYGTGNLDFIIRGINHTVTTKGWVTKLETITTPIPK